MILKLFSVKMVTTIVFKNPKILSSKNLLKMTEMAFAVLHKDQPNDFFDKALSLSSYYHALCKKGKDIVRAENN